MDDALTRAVHAEMADTVGESVRAHQPEQFAPARIGCLIPPGGGGHHVILRCDGEFGVADRTLFPGQPVESLGAGGFLQNVAIHE